jgi:hypothetical protein
VAQLLTRLLPPARSAFPLESATPVWTLEKATFSSTTPVLPVPGSGSSGAITTAVPTSLKEESMKKDEPMLPTMLFLPWRLFFLLVVCPSSGRSWKPMFVFLTVMDFQT